MMYTCGYFARLPVGSTPRVSNRPLTNAIAEVTNTAEPVAVVGENGAQPASVSHDSAQNCLEPSGEKCRPAVGAVWDHVRFRRRQRRCPVGCTYRAASTPSRTPVCSEEVALAVLVMRSISCPSKPSSTRSMDAKSPQCFARSQTKGILEIQHVSCAEISRAKQISVQSTTSRIARLQDRVALSADTRDLGDGHCSNRRTQVAKHPHKGWQGVVAVTRTKTR